VPARNAPQKWNRAPPSLCLPRNQPPEKIAFTWRWEAERAAAETLVAAEFFELQKGGSTEVVLTRERFASEEEKQKHNDNWAGCLEQLANFL
jgi:uncharacterized protein YndB with AHSA1/START domain